MTTTDTNTAQALADARRLIDALASECWSRRARPHIDIAATHLAARTAVDRLASLASQAAEQAPVAEVRAKPGTTHGTWVQWFQMPKPGQKLYTAPVREQSERDAERWRELVQQHEFDDDQATHNNYGRTYPERTLCVFQDDGEDGLEPVPCDPGELAKVVDAAIAAKKEQHRG